MKILLRTGQKVQLRKIRFFLGGRDGRARLGSRSAGAVEMAQQVSSASMKTRVLILEAHVHAEEDQGRDRRFPKQTSHLNWPHRRALGLIEQPCLIE